MSLYLGKIGRRILNYTVTHPRLNSAVDVFGKIAHKATFGRYTPGLTRETFSLFQKSGIGDSIDIRGDGFYKDGEKIAGNIYVSEAFRKRGIRVVNFEKFNSPEKLANSARNRVFVLMSKTLTTLGLSTLLISTGLSIEWVRTQIASTLCEMEGIGDTCIIGSWWANGNAESKHTLLSTEAPDIRRMRIDFFRLADEIDNISQIHNKLLKSYYSQLLSNDVESNLTLGKMEALSERASLIRANAMNIFRDYYLATNSDMIEVTSGTPRHYFPTDIYKTYNTDEGNTPGNIRRELAYYATISGFPFASSEELSYCNLRAKHPLAARILPREILAMRGNTSRAAHYISYRYLSLKWDIFARQKEIHALFTPHRIETIKSISSKHNVDPNLIAGIILAEQRDQTLIEDEIDILGSRFGSTSVGLGQVYVGTAKRLFPDRTKGRSNHQIALMLRNDEGFNIECVCALISDIIREHQLRHRNAQDIKTIGNIYSGQTNSIWGDFVKMSYADMLFSGIFGGSKKEATKLLFEIQSREYQIYNSAPPCDY